MGEVDSTQCGTLRCREREPSTPSMADKGSFDGKEPDRAALEPLPLRLVALSVRQTRDAVARAGHRCSADRVGCGIEGCRAWRQSSGGSSAWPRSATTIASSAPDRTAERGSCGPVLSSSGAARLRHFATVLGLTSGSRLSVAGETCDRLGLPLGWRAWSWRSRDEPGPWRLPPFPRKHRTIKPREQIRSAIHAAKIRRCVARPGEPGPGSSVIAARCARSF